MQCTDLESLPRSSRNYKDIPFKYLCRYSVIGLHTGGGGSDNRAMRRPGKTSLDGAAPSWLNTDHVATPSTPQLKGKYRSVLRLLKYPQTVGKSNFQMFFS